MEKKLHDSATNETNTMYDIQFAYFNFITNGSQQGDLHFSSFQLTADCNSNGCFSTTGYCKWKEPKWDTKPNVEAGHIFIRGSEM